MATENRDLIIEAKNLQKNYGPVQALREASFSVREGEIIALLGPNGAGKTTIMKILTGYMEPSSGQVHIDGLALEDHRLMVQKRIGYLPENAPIYGDMLVQDYLLFAGRLRGLPEGELIDRIAEAVGNTGLQEVLIRPIGELSKGYRQRVGLAQAILHRPKLLILDEPTNGLDPTQIVEMRGLIKRLAKHATVVLSTHILSEAEATCDRAIMIIQGEVKADARLSELSQSSEVLLTVMGIAAGGHAEIVNKLQKISGIIKVEREGENRFRVYGGNQGVSSQELALQVFKQVKTEGWDICELKPEVRTLEAVFKELALKPFSAATEVGR